MLDNFAFNIEPQQIEKAKNQAQRALEADKRKEVFLNTLAVQVVDTYLGWTDVETDLQLSASMHPIVQSMYSAMDLYLPEYSCRLNCYPVLSDELTLEIYFPSRNDCIGTLVIQFEKNLNKAYIVGFLPPSFWFEERVIKKVNLNSLLPLDHLFKYFWLLEEGINLLESQISQIENSTIRNSIQTALQTKSISEVVLHLERIYSEEQTNIKVFRNRDVLISEAWFGELMRDQSEGTFNELQKSLNILFEKLASVWNTALDNGFQPVEKLSDWFNGFFRGYWMDLEQSYRG